MPKDILFLIGFVLKFVPLIVTAVPAVAIVGVNPVIVGAIWFPTVNVFAPIVEPDGDIILIGPVVAPDGTEVTILVAVAEITAAVRPLKATVF